MTTAKRSAGFFAGLERLLRATFGNVAVDDFVQRYTGEPTRLCQRCFSKDVHVHATYYAFKAAGPCAVCKKITPECESVALMELR